MAKIAIGTPPQVVKIAPDTSTISITSVLEKDCYDFDSYINETTYKDGVCFKDEYLFSPNASSTCEKTGMFCDSVCTNSAGIGEWMSDTFVVSLTYIVFIRRILIVFRLETHPTNKTPYH